MSVVASVETGLENLSTAMFFQTEILKEALLFFLMMMLGLLFQHLELGLKGANTNVPFLLSASGV